MLGAHRRGLQLCCSGKFLSLAFSRVVYLFVLTCGRDGMVSYCDMQPSEKIMCSFKKRGDNQITSLEILSIALGEYKI